MASVSRNDVVENFSLYSQHKTSDIKSQKPDPQLGKMLAAEVGDLYTAFVGGPSDQTTQSISQEFFTKQGYSANSNFSKSLTNMKALLELHGLDSHIPTVDYVQKMVLQGNATKASTASAAETVTRGPRVGYMATQSGEVVEKKTVLKKTFADPRQAQLADLMYREAKPIEVSSDGKTVTTQDGKKHNVKQYS